jgi:hypothetical protein
MDLSCGTPNILFDRSIIVLRELKPNLAFLANLLLAKQPYEGIKMSTLNIKMATLAIGLAFSASAMAEAMTKTDYKASKARISAEYKTGKSGCASLSDNAKDICIVEAKGKQKVARAELEASYRPTPRNQYKALVAKADADFLVAREKCDDLAGDPKRACVLEAKVLQTAAMSDATKQTGLTEYSPRKDR